MIVPVLVREQSSCCEDAQLRVWLARAGRLRQISTAYRKRGVAIRLPVFHLGPYADRSYCGVIAELQRLLLMAVGDLSLLVEMKRLQQRFNIGFIHANVLQFFRPPAFIESAK